MTGNAPYDNPTSQSERRRILKDTMHTRALAEQGTIGGRFAAEARTRVVGSKPAIEYPPQPPNSPWADDPTGQEPALGYSIEDQAPSGEVFEIQKLAEQAAGGGIENLISPPAGPLSSEAGSDTASQPSAVETTSLPSKQRRGKRR